MRRYLVSSIVLAAAGSASAQPRQMTSAAKVELELGLERYGAHDYANAIAAFDAGYAIDPHPDFLYAKAQAQRLGGDCRGAVVTYNAFLDTKPPQREADVARGNVAKCERLLAASTPSPEPEPRPHAEEAVPRGPERDRGEPAQVEHPAWYADRPGLVLAGGGLVALGVAALFVVRAQSSADDAQNASLLGEWTTAHDAWVTDRIVVGVSAGVGAALLIGAGYRFWSASRHVDRVVARPAANGQGAVLSLEGRW